MATQPRLRQKQLGRDDPKTNWPEYNKGRSQEGELFIHWIMQMAISVREIMGMVPGTRDRRVSAILVSILKSKDRLSYWSMVSHFDKYPVYLERCELSMQYYTSWYHLCVSEICPAVLQKIMARMAGNRAVHDTLLADSGGFGAAKYIDCSNAKYGSISVRLFTKLHLMHTLHGMVCAATGYPRKFQRLAAPAGNGEDASGRRRRRLDRRCLRRG